VGNPIMVSVGERLGWRMPVPYRKASSARAGFYNTPPSKPLSMLSSLGLTCTLGYSLIA